MRLGSFSAQKAAYFYQFGIMSSFPLANGGWKVSMTCPALLAAGSWSSVQHAAALRGSDPYWKVIWRWGEDYPGVTVSSGGAGSLTFTYSMAGGTKSFEALW